MALLDDIRSAAARVAAQAGSVRLDADAARAYAAGLGWAQPTGADPEVVPLAAEPEARAGFVLALDAVNFGSGWFPTLNKPPGRSGYFTVALALRRRFEAEPDFFSIPRLRTLDPAELAATLGQPPDHELMALYARALRELGERIAEDYDGRVLALLGAAHDSAEHLAELLSGWPGFADRAVHGGRTVPLYKRAQIAAADLHGAGLLAAQDLGRLTAFADNLVPHVLRVDGVLTLERGLEARIDGGELLEHGSPEEVELRACAVHAVELMVAARGDGMTAAQVDGVLWRRGAGARYKRRPRHRARCTAY